MDQPKASKSTGLVNLNSDVCDNQDRPEDRTDAGITDNSAQQVEMFIMPARFKALNPDSTFEDDDALVDSDCEDKSDSIGPCSTVDGDDQIVNSANSELEKPKLELSSDPEVTSDLKSSNSENSEMEFSDSEQLKNLDNEVMHCDLRSRDFKDKKETSKVKTKQTKFKNKGDHSCEKMKSLKDSELINCETRNCNDQQNTGSEGLELENSEPEDDVVQQMIISMNPDLFCSKQDTFRCDLCGKVFAQSKYLKKHRRVHSGERPFKCDVCGKSFAQSSNLSRHKKVHSGEKSHKCDICQVQFTHACSLAQHKLIHTGEKPYRCDMCGKQFTQSGNLSQHKLIHSGEKPHKCDICDKQFAHSGNLARHKLVHTGEMPHKCNECGRQFTHPFSLSQHKLIWHTNEKPYKCDICDAQFTNSGNLKQHKYIHTGEKPHKCDMCTEEFTHSGSLVRHKETEHKVSKVEVKKEQTVTTEKENQIIDKYIESSLHYYLMNGAFRMESLDSIQQAVEMSQRNNSC